MKSELINVTPQMASNWLSQNINNRPLRRSMVDGLKAAFQRGEYITTHQGIAFSENGELLDGQHRLTAISEMRDGSFPMLVSSGVDENSFSVMDIGVKRTQADALRLDDRRVVEVARLIANFVTNRQIQVTPLMLLPIIEGIQRTHDRLVSFCATSAKTWSSAPVRLAAVVSIDCGSNEDYVKTTFRALVHSDFESMSPVAQSLYRSGLDGRVRAANTADMLARCLVAFDDKKAGLRKVQISDTSPAVQRVKNIYGCYVASEQPIEKKKATPVSVAKSVSHRDFTTVLRRKV